LIIVQHLTTVWTKASRGAPAANRRKAVPWAIPIDIREEAPWVFQSADFAESSDFTYRSDRQFTRHTHRERDRGLLLELLPDGLHVGFRWEPEVGLPPRHERQNAFILAPERYGRVIVNGRHSLDEGHWYTQSVYNVVVIASRPMPNIFTARDPDELLDLRETLF